MQLNISYQRMGAATSQAISVNAIQRGPSLFQQFDYNGITLWGFDSTIAGGGTYVLTHLCLPEIFPEVAREFPTGLQGLFLLDLPVQFPIGGQTAKDSFGGTTCKGVGEFDCPYQILLDDMSKSSPRTHFKFLGHKFFPFLMRNFNVGYFVCDASSSTLDWDRQTGDFVSVYQPITYDPLLGLFITRGAKKIQ